MSCGTSGASFRRDVSSRKEIADARRKFFTAPFDVSHIDPAAVDSARSLPNERSFPRGRVYPGHPRLASAAVKTWVPGTRPGTGANELLRLEAVGPNGRVEPAEGLPGSV